jgi:dephospho-CoA kinase
MLLVGLTGGIGSGKTSVSSRLAERGAVVVDADAIVRELQAPGQAVLAAMVERFGESILLPDGSLDRQAVADLVFNDDAARADLGAIVHPAVRDEIARRVLDQADTDNVVILDIPLLAESGWDGIAGTIVVDLDPEIAVQRLVEFRGFTEADARARIAKASVVVDNSLDLEHLEAEVDKVWAWIESQRTAQRDA